MEPRVEIAQVQIDEVEFPGNSRNAEFFLIGIDCKSDKFWHHHYYNFYPKFIQHYKTIKNCAMLEIGVQSKYSLELWLKYFPNAFIYGIDINVSEESERYKIIKADQSDPVQIDNSIRIMNHPLFLIIDDGSHIPEHQLLTFDKMFHILLPGGTYIIEDIETSYWSKNSLYSYKTQYGFKHPKSIIEIFKLIVDDINTLFLTEENKGIQNDIISSRISNENRKNISTITFTRNTIIITKKTKQEIEHCPINYNYAKNL
jgi:hypothetical protein